MAEFSRGIRKWWMKVVTFSDGYPRDQTMIYDEEKGFYQSSARADEVHHITPGRYAEVVLGERANDQLGLPVARRKHGGGGTTLPFCNSSTFHKDVDKARRQYRAGDKSAFKKMSERHERKAAKGQRYWGGDEGADQFYSETMQEKAVRYVAATGDKKPESGKPKPRKRHWSDGLFD